MYVIITRNQCNFCDDAKALLKGKGYSFVTYNVQEQSSKWVLTLIKQAGYTTVPQVFDPQGKHIGGYTELKEYIHDDHKKTL
jgi:glutaredoxin